MYQNAFERHMDVLVRDKDNDVFRLYEQHRKIVKEAQERKNQEQSLEDLTNAIVKSLEKSIEKAFK